VRSIPAVYKAPEISVYAIYPPTRELSVKVRLMIDFLVERFGGRPYWDLIEIGICERPRPPAGQL
jgi:DNA-binding transcriptional LysR family regulator